MSAAVAQSLSRALAVVSRRGDLAVAAILLVAVAMIIVPLPTGLVDVLITTNLAVSALVLLVAFYAARPTEMSSLPSIILVATLFRLAITISTSRLILLQGDAGEIVTAFGDFVIGGNIAVGLTIFLIITIAQFVVITKGAERVAEVAARFSLDSLPGKQMSIDADLRSGDIDQAEARRLRTELQRESQLYGAMDGAMKFVKGDAIASIVVVLVNLVGGLAIGTMQQGKALGEAAELYSLLTVGDGLVAQIPALLVSVAAGVVVTRVVSNDDRDLGADIAGQLFSDPRALGLAAVVLLGLAVVPGFPAPVFLVLAVVFGGAAYALRRLRPATTPPTTAPSVTSVEAPALAMADPQDVDMDDGLLLDDRSAIVVHLGNVLAAAIPPAAFRERLDGVRWSILDDLGVELPSIGRRVGSTGIGAERFRIDIEGVPVAEGDIPAGCVLVDDDPEHLDLLDVKYRIGPAIVGRRDAVWVAAVDQAALAEAGVGASAPAAVLAARLEEVLRHGARQFIGIQETRAMLGKLEGDYGELVREAERIAPLQKIADILRRLLEEDVPIRQLRLILEALIEWGPREQDVAALVEYIRVALRRQICFRCADQNRVIMACMLDHALEETVRASVQVTAVGAYLNISEEAARPLLDQVARIVAGCAAGDRPVVLTSMELRRHVRMLLTHNELDLPVLSYQELAPEFSIMPLAAVGDGVARSGGPQAVPPPFEFAAAEVEPASN
jgi:type III secretion protein V